MVVTVHEGDTLMDLLQQAGISATPAQSAIDALKQRWDPRALKIGQEVAIGIDDYGLKELRLTPDPQRDIKLLRGDDGHFDVVSVPRAIVHVPARSGGIISSSLFEAASDVSMPPAVLAELLNAFSYDVDFQREIQPGDRFEVMYDQLVDRASGKIVGTGDLLYAAMTLSGRLLQLYRYTPPGGEPGFYTADGASVKKALLRTPVDGARISSSFGMRHHPILGYTAMHKGVDFAVPRGTPIIASGDGVVASVGRAGSYGNLVVLDHEGGYSTAYAHMSRFAKGLRRGMHVRQGQVIGYVGATGRATGPHLHYEVRLNDHAINPLGVRMASTQKLQGRDFAALKQQETLIALRLAGLRESTVAAK